VAADVRDAGAMDALFERYGKRIALVIHTAAQPSHDWAANDPQTDFTVNANGTLCVLEATRKFAPSATFIFTSTNKVYGDVPNELPLQELPTRWEIDPAHPFWDGIDETMRIDQSKHSLFGASKVAADVLVQEYGRYFGLATAVFRGGCLTGPNHSGTKLHGFLAYLMKCVATGEKYTVFGYKGKQVRDNIHSLDVARFVAAFVAAPRRGEVYNLGGGKANSTSILEAFKLAESFSGRAQVYSYVEQNRIGDHICYYSDLRRMRKHFPSWDITQSLAETVRQIVESWRRPRV
jgi:CDP-paratose 2-epimerase